MFLSGFNLVVLSLLVIGWLVLFVLLFLWLKKGGAAASVKPRPKAPAATPPPPVKKEDVLTPQPTREGRSDSVLLAIEVPKENETTPLAAELMFASLHGIYKAELVRRRGLQQHLSFEIQAKEKSIRFFVWAPRELQGYVEGQIYAQYPDVNVFEVKDYAKSKGLELSPGKAYAELVLNREDIFPIKTFESFDVDPLAGVTATLSKLEETDQVWIQILVRPENDKWRDRAINYISAVRSGRQTFGRSLAKGLGGLASDVVRTAVTGEVPTSEEKKVELAPGVEEALKRIEEKSTKLGFQTKIRLVAFSRAPTAAQQKLDLVVGAFKQFNTTNLNGFVSSPVKASAQEALDRYFKRQFTAKGSILNVTELASIYHLPSKTVATPHIVWAGSKKGEPPANLPLADEVEPALLTNLGTTDFRGSQEKFGIKLDDRRRHVYVIGKSGVGKSTLLENMSLDDIKEKRGVGVVDPHGEYVDYILDRIPSYRMNDVIVFDPGDREFPIGFNVLEVDNPKYKVVVTSGVVGVFKKIFGDSWGPRLEYWLSSAILALIDYPNATLMMVPRLFTDDAFRGQVVEKIVDPVIRARWINEYDKLDQRQRNETISPILNKVGQFLSSPVIRNIVGQPKSAISMRQVMDEGKILLIKLSKGLIGEDNAALLGSLLITQIQLAAMSRADTVDPEARKDFFLYVDEFQNFATDSFAAILSEARKYRLSLTLAHQYIAQLSEVVSKSIFGNIGTIVTFRIGGEDAAFLKSEFTPVFDEQDLVNLDVFKVYIKLSIDGLTAGAFSATTLPPSTQRTHNADKIIKLSRERYARGAAFVESKLTEQSAPVDSVSRPPAARPTGRRPMSGPQRTSPKLDALKRIITGVEKRKKTSLRPEDKENIAKGLLDDLKDASGSMKEALEQARKKKEEEQRQAREIKPNEIVEIEPPKDVGEDHNEQ